MLARLLTLCRRSAIKVFGLLTGSLIALLVFAVLSLKTPPHDLGKHINKIERNIYVDRYGKRLNISYENEWNIHDTVDIHEVPEFLRAAFVLSEDKRFFEHDGIDWLARSSAIKDNVLSGKVVRGASTISEQVVRMINPRPRTLWSRWLEGFEAMLLEAGHSKLEILEFYLNQVPYKARRRGIVQAGHYYFDRDLDTLNEKEMLALSVLVRSPRWLDPVKQRQNLRRSLEDLALRMDNQGLLTKSKKTIMAQQLALRESESDYNVQHFISFAKAQADNYNQNGDVIHTTLDLELQTRVQEIVDNRLQALKKQHVNNAAALVIDHEKNEILSWVVGYAGHKGKAFNQLNAVLAKRQPGSALKPLLYAKAMLHGWTAATMLDDSPLQESVGLGMHTYHNYSRAHYGMVSLRESLGNSLNIPAVKAIQFIGPEDFLTFLSQLGIESLSGHPNVYGDGLALGNGELTLYELVHAYTVLARMGDYKPLSFLAGQQVRQNSYRVFSEDVASIIADILSDPGAREKEFGWGSILNFPYQTAVKTGTSSDYRDAWAIGFNDKYTVGVWLGNLDYSEMRKVTGSSGPALALRSIFNELNRNREVRPLYFSQALVKQRVCIESGLLVNDTCESRDEWFVSGTHPSGMLPSDEKIRLRKPSKGLLLAMDPRIPDEHEYFEFALTNNENIQHVKWFVNDRLIATTEKPVFNWKLSRGEFTAYAEIRLNEDKQIMKTERVAYKVN